MSTRYVAPATMADNDSAADRFSSTGRDSISKQYDWGATVPSAAVVETVAVATDTEPTELDRLQDTVDADALDALVGRGDRDASLQVAFEYAGTEVRVDRNGTVTVVLD